MIDILVETHGFSLRRYLVVIFLLKEMFNTQEDLGENDPIFHCPRNPSSYSQMMSKGCPITETKRMGFRFHETILRFGEPGSLRLDIFQLSHGQKTRGPLHPLQLT